MGKEKGYKNLELGRGWNKGQSNKGKYQCPVCGKIFYKRIYKKQQAVYCSQRCAYKGRSMGITKRVVKVPYNIDRTPSDWRYKKCQVCGNNYVANKRSQKYCSRKCYEVSKKEDVLGKKNPSYKDGSSYLKRGYRGDDWDTIRMGIYRRDNFICQKCGIKCESKRSYIDVNNVIQCHHIEEYNGENNNNDNLITLCLKCHLKEHNEK